MSSVKPGLEPHVLLAPVWTRSSFWMCCKRKYLYRQTLHTPVLCEPQADAFLPGEAAVVVARMELLTDWKTSRKNKIYRQEGQDCCTYEYSIYTGICPITALLQIQKVHGSVNELNVCLITCCSIMSAISRRLRSSSRSSLRAPFSLTFNLSCSASSELCCFASSFTLLSEEE